MVRLTLSIVLAAAMLLQRAGPSANRPAGAWQQYADPAEAGYDPAALAEARTFAEQSGSAAVLLVQHGRVVLAWGNPTQRFRLASIRKSILSLMFGSPVVASKIRVDQTLGDLGIDDREPLTVAERGATVDHLLSARSGVYLPAAFEPASMIANRPARGSAAPGREWFYNNWDFNALGTVYRTQTGMDVFTGFRTTIVAPLGLEDFRPQDGVYVREPSRSRHPAYEFRLTARDLARIGQLVVQDGRWEGREVVTPTWLANSLKIRTPFPEGGGYAYLWWIDAGRFVARGRALPALDAVTDIVAKGLGEQLLLVVPSQKLVLVHLTAGESSSLAELVSYRLAEMILQARRSDPQPGAKTAPVTPHRFSKEPPPFPERVAVPLSGNPAELVGEYEVGPNVRATISYVDDGLFIHMPGRGEAELFQESRDTFFLRVADVVLTFQRDSSGRVDGILVNDRGRQIRGKKIGAP